MTPPEQPDADRTEDDTAQHTSVLADVQDSGTGGSTEKLAAPQPADEATATQAAPADLARTTEVDTSSVAPPPWQRGGTDNGAAAQPTAVISTAQPTAVISTGEPPAPEKPAARKPTADRPVAVNPAAATESAVEETIATRRPPSSSSVASMSAASEVSGTSGTKSGSLASEDGGALTEAAPTRPTPPPAAPQRPARPAEQPTAAHPTAGHPSQPHGAPLESETIGSRTMVNLGTSGTQVRPGNAPTPNPLRRPGRGPRRASLQLKRVDPWSVLKLAFVLSIAMFFVWLVAVGVLYGVLDGMGVWDKVNSGLGDIVQGTNSTSGPLVSAGRVFGIAAILGAINIVLFTALATVGSFIYNVAADLAGGLEITLAERE